MELREYIRILVKSWWLIIPMTLISMTLTVLFSYDQTPIYESSSTYVTRLDSSMATNADQTIYALDTLSSRQRIFVTYCEVMTSQSSLDRGLELLNITSGSISMEKYDVYCNVLPESNVLMLIVRGPVPAIVDKLNASIGLAGIERINQLYTFFPVENLDTTVLEESPISPNHMSNTILGGALGVIVSVTIALLNAHFQDPAQQIAALSIRDAHLNVYKDTYFQRRLIEELKRAQHRNRSMCIVFLKLVLDEDFSLLPEKAKLHLLRSASLHIQDDLQHGDIVAYRGNRIFEMLIPERSGHETVEMLEHLHSEIRGRTHTTDQHVANFMAISVVVESGGEDVDATDMQERGLDTLGKAEKVGQRTISLIKASQGTTVYVASLPDEADDDLDNEGDTVDSLGETKPSFDRDFFSIDDFEDEV
jgi:capsular polysaccharide biosynthesis protein